VTDPSSLSDPRSAVASLGPVERSKVEEILFSANTTAGLKPIWHALDDLLVAGGTERDAKTVSVSYTSPTGKVVAAVHPNPVHQTIQVALAVPPDTTSTRLEDMSLLRWRTMPSGLTLSSVSDIDDEVRELVRAATESSESTAVSNDFYVTDRDRRIRSRIRERWDGPTST
jgi:hypothetical protein